MPSRAQHWTLSSPTHGGAPRGKRHRVVHQQPPDRLAVGPGRTQALGMRMGAVGQRCRILRDQHQAMVTHPFFGGRIVRRQDGLPLDGVVVQEPVRRRGGVGRPAGRRHVRGRLGVEHAGHLQQSRGQASIAHVGASQLRLDPLPRRTRFRRCADPDRAIGSTAQHRLPRRIQRQDVTVRGRGPGAVAPAAARGPHMPPGGRAITGARTTPALHGCSSTRRSIHPARCAPGTAVGRRTGGRSSGTGVRPSCRATGPTGGAR